MCQQSGATKVQPVLNCLYLQAWQEKSNVRVMVFHLQPAVAREREALNATFGTVECTRTRGQAIETAAAVRLEKCVQQELDVDRGQLTDRHGWMRTCA